MDQNKMSHKMKKVWNLIHTHETLITEACSNKVVSCNNEKHWNWGAREEMNKFVVYKKYKSLFILN